MSPEQMRNQKLGASVVKALKSRKFDAYYVDTKQEAIDLALSLIPSGDTVSWGGSMTIRDMGLTMQLKMPDVTPSLTEIMLRRVRTLLDWRLPAIHI